MKLTGSGELLVFIGRVLRSLNALAGRARGLHWTPRAVHLQECLK